MKIIKKVVVLEKKKKKKITRQGGFSVTPPKIYPTWDGSQMSKRDQEAETILEELVELSGLKQSDELWIKRNCGYYSKGQEICPKRYDVYTPNGNHLFRATQISESERNFDETTGPFHFSVFNMKTGNEIFKIVRNPKGGKSVIVFVHEKFAEYRGIGKILQIKRGYPIFGPTFNIRGMSGHIIMKLKGGISYLYKSSIFTAIRTDSNLETGQEPWLGEIEKRPEGQSIQEDCAELAKIDPIYIIKFIDSSMLSSSSREPATSSLTDKIFLMTSVLLLDFDYFKTGWREKQANMFLIGAIIAIFVIIFALFILLFCITVTDTNSYTTSIKVMNSSHKLLFQQLIKSAVVGEESRELVEVFNASFVNATAPATNTTK